MPVYGYRCERCGDTFEFVHPNGEWRFLCSTDCRQEEMPGVGTLARVMGTPSIAIGARGGLYGRGVDFDKAGRKGLGVYKRQRDGSYERIAGKQGPATISREHVERLKREDE